MAALMSRLDASLGPLSPAALALRTAPPPLPVIVFTASGDQGRSVADSLLSDGGYVVTALTKFPNSDAAHGLREKGAKVVQGDMADFGSYEGYLKGQKAAFIAMDCESNYILRWGCVPLCSGA